MTKQDDMEKTETRYEKEQHEELILKESIVRIQLNYDGTQIIDAHNFKHFLEDTTKEQ